MIEATAHVRVDLIRNSNPTARLEANERVFTAMALLDEQISCGWGDVPQEEIPTNWRTVPGPGPLYGPEEALAAVDAQENPGAALRARKRGRRGIAKAQRMVELAERMRAGQRIQADRPAKRV